jgi:hypothetical protein
LASVDFDQPNANNDYTNNNKFYGIDVIWPHYIGIQLRSQKEDPVSGSGGLRATTLQNIFVHGHTTQYASEPAPYAHISIKNFTGLFITNVNCARVPNDQPVLVLDGIKTSEGYGVTQSGRRAVVKEIMASGIGGTQSSQGIKLINCSDMSFDAISFTNDFQNGFDASLDSDCTRVYKGLFHNAGGREPVIVEQGSGNYGWNTESLYFFRNTSLRNVSGFNNARNTSGQIQIANPDETGTVVFPEPEINNSYQVFLSVSRNVVFSYAGLTTTGFTVRIVRNGETNPVNVTWMVMR